MNELDQKTCMLWAKMPQFARLIKWTEDNVRASLSVVARPYIAFSCGKDSSVLADIVLSVNPKIPLRFVSRGETRILYKNVDEVLQYFRDKYSAHIEEIMFDRIFSNGWEYSSFHEQCKAGKNDTRKLESSAYDGVFMGLRKAESRGREISLTKCYTHGLPAYMYRYDGRNYYRICPLANWDTKDVGAYIQKNGLPTLDWYEKQGIKSRTASRISEAGIACNMLYWLKVDNPSGYYQLLKRFPELAAIT